jgi:2-methylcitrate dehydratase PrpD
MLNVLGTAVGAARTPAVEAVISAARDSDSRDPSYVRSVAGARVVVPGRTGKLDAFNGALAIGIAAHLDDFDDTHLRTVIHPGACALAAVLALVPGTEPGGAPDGATVLTAFALGCEAQLRIGNAISPSHYERGWHITGSCGAFGAAVAAGVLLGLSAGELEQALSLAATMTVGHREAFGSMTKAFHAGKAASNGLLAAWAARDGVTGPADPLGGAGLAILADSVDFGSLLPDSSAPWELESNTFKPYPCGIVAHPGIDAAIEASGLVDPGEITSVVLSCHPLVPELMGRQQPGSGLEARFSAYHAVAVGLLDGAAGLAQFSDSRACDASVARLRGLIELSVDPACARDSARIVVSRSDGEPVAILVPHARGSLDRPLTDEELEEKVARLVEPVLGAGAGARIRKAVDELGGAPGVSALVGAVTPSRDSPGFGTREDTREGVDGASAIPATGPDPAPDASAPNSDPGSDSGSGVTAALAEFIARAEPPAVLRSWARADMRWYRNALLAGDSPDVGAIHELVFRVFDSDLVVGAPWSALMTGTSASAGKDAIRAGHEAGPPEGQSDVGAPAGNAGAPGRVAVCVAALAVTEARAATASQIGDAIAIGLEVSARVHAALGPSHRAAGWCPDTTAGVIGAGAAAGRVLGLSPQQLAHTLGICATQAAGLMAAAGTPAAHLQEGKAAANAVEAAFLAEAGFTSSAAPLEGRRGLLALMSSAPDPAALTADLGQVWLTATLPTP